MTPASAMTNNCFSRQWSHCSNVCQNKWKFHEWIPKKPWIISENGICVCVWNFDVEWNDIYIKLQWYKLGWEGFHPSQDASLNHVTSTAIPETPGIWGSGTPMPSMVMVITWAKMVESDLAGCRCKNGTTTTTTTKYGNKRRWIYNNPNQETVDWT